ncbi:MAG: hypothetical protein Q8R32_02735, partial [bacterium]|nr:hypothetical protein [bacterium]
MPDTVDLRQNAASSQGLFPASAIALAAEPQSLPPNLPILAWETPEFHPQRKGTLWYAVFGVALAGLVFIAFLLRSFLSGVVFVLSGLLILIYSERPPRALRIQITRDDLLINDRRYLLRDLEAFNIVESPTGMLALIRSRRLVMPLIHLPLADQDPDAVRRALRRGIKEDSA